MPKWRRCAKTRRAGAEEAASPSALLFVRTGALVGGVWRKPRALPSAEEGICPGGSAPRFPGAAGDAASRIRAPARLCFQRRRACCFEDFAGMRTAHGERRGMRAKRRAPRFPGAAGDAASRIRAPARLCFQRRRAVDASCRDFPRFAVRGAMGAGRAMPRLEFGPRCKDSNGGAGAPEALRAFPSGPPGTGRRKTHRRDGSIKTRPVRRTHRSRR